MSVFDFTATIKETYAMFAESTDNVTAKQIFQQMMQNNQNVTKTETKIIRTNKNNQNKLNLAKPGRHPAFHNNLCTLILNSLSLILTQ